MQAEQAADVATCRVALRLSDRVALDAVGECLGQQRDRVDVRPAVAAAELEDVEVRDLRVARRQDAGRAAGADALDHVRAGGQHRQVDEVCLRQVGDRVDDALQRDELVELVLNRCEGRLRDRVLELRDDRRQRVVHLADDLRVQLVGQLLDRGLDRSELRHLTEEAGQTELHVDETGQVLRVEEVLRDRLRAGDLDLAEAGRERDVKAVLELARERVRAAAAGVLRAPRRDRRRVDAERLQDRVQRARQRVGETERVVDGLRDPVHDFAVVKRDDFVEVAHGVEQARHLCRKRRKRRSRDAEHAAERVLQARQGGKRQLEVKRLRVRDAVQSVGDRRCGLRTRARRYERSNGDGKNCRRPANAVPNLHDLPPWPQSRRLYCLRIRSDEQSSFRFFADAPGQIERVFGRPLRSGDVRSCNDSSRQKATLAMPVFW